MLRRALPMSNNERQRLFRERNPGYYGRLHARQRAAVRAALAAAQEAKAIHVKPAPLMLPAPVEVIEIPGMTTIPNTIDALRERVTVRPSAE